MKLLFIADGRSPIALSWIQFFIEQGHAVHLASTFPCRPEPGLASFEFIPVALSGAKSNAADAVNGKSKGLLWGAALLKARTALRQWIGPLTLPHAAHRLKAYVAAVQPDLVHAMRIPYEGMLAARADLPAPLLISVWGNDLTLHAPSTPLMKRCTRQALARTDALHTDCRRDIRLACAWGFPGERHSIVLPGSGGVRTDVFYPPPVPDPAPLVINPRGFRAYVRNDVFFRSIPQVLQEWPEAKFICPNMAGEAKVLEWIAGLGIAQAVEILPQAPREEMASLFRRAWVTVSPSFHDGTPNTLLEAMACGSFPIAGDLESIREWIVPGINGLLVDPADPAALARAILTAFQDSQLRARAARHNVDLIHQRAEYFQGMGAALEFYKGVVDRMRSE